MSNADVRGYIWIGIVLRITLTLLRPIHDILQAYAVFLGAFTHV